MTEIGSHIRRATREDAPIIRELTRVAYAHWVSVIGREPLPMLADYDAAVRVNLIDLLELETEVVGLVEMIPEETSLLIENIAVHPDHQSKGYGSQLLRHAEQVALDLRLPQLRLYTNAAFDSNLVYYEHRGYREVLREVVIPGNTTVHMTKDV